MNRRSLALVCLVVGTGSRSCLTTDRSPTIPFQGGLSAYVPRSSMLFIALRSGYEAPRI
jgi:hypothetical protein